MMTPTTANCHAAALEYAEGGWRVLPLHVPLDGGCDCRKLRDCPTPGKHPRVQKWPEKATTDRATINDWWAMWPESNVGIATGGLLLVLDIDEEEGWTSLGAFVKQHGRLPDTPCVATGGGGAHYYFAAPGPRRSFTVAPGLEVKCDGSLVVAPPSLHVSGRRYEWVVPPQSWQRQHEEGAS